MGEALPDEGARMLTVIADRSPNVQVGENSFPILRFPNYVLFVLKWYVLIKGGKSYRMYYVK